MQKKPLGEKRRSVKAARRLFLKMPPVFFLCCALLPGCSRSLPEEAAGESSPGGFFPAHDKLLALVKPGPEPLWFEIAPGGPVLISSPEEASLVSWHPWPGARFITDILLEGNRLVMAVNREGFLVWVPPEGDDPEGAASLYLVDLSEYWDPFTIAGFFYYQGLPAALLCRDQVFLKAPDGLEEEGTGIFPEKRVWTILGFDASPNFIPAFEGLEGLWDIKALRPGRDDSWYFRAERDGDRPRTAYFRAENLFTPAEAVSFGVFRNAMKPYNIKEVPGPLLAALERAVQWVQTGENPIARAVFSGDSAFAGARYYGAEGANTVELHGFCSAAGGGAFAGAAPSPQAVNAAVIYPDGRGVYSAGGGLGEFSLPALPEGFLYTRIGLAGGRCFIAAWEEQQDFSIAAAGFVVITIPGTGRESAE